MTSEPDPVPPAEQSAERPTGKRRIGLFASAAFVVLALDIVTKVLVVAKLPTKPLHDPVRILGGAIYLQQIRNSGAAFSLGTGFTVILSVIAIVVVVVLIRIAGRLRSIGWALAFGFILGGAVGNLVDRFFRAPGVGRGHVVDFVSLFGPNGEHWPIFNLADAGIVVGAILAAALALANVEFDGRKTGRAAARDRA